MYFYCCHMFRELKRMFYSDKRLRHRRKEISIKYQLYQHKMKQTKYDLKKKKKKQNHLRNNNSKVDAFARGGGSGR